MECFADKKFGNECSNETKQSSMKAYTIGGVPILFPYRAYPSQITMMDKIVKCLNNGYNCLLESPTGSGKSLALLCASLAWQKKTKKIIAEQELKMERELEASAAAIQAECDAANDLENKAKEACAKELLTTIKKEADVCCTDSPSKIDMKLNSTVARLNLKLQKKERSKRSVIFLGDDDEKDLEDFKSIKKFRSSLGSPAANIPDHTSSKSVIQNRENSCSSKIETKPVVANDCASKCLDSKSVKSKSETEDSTPFKLPTIYFGTRTHKQLEQIIRELKKTPYKDSRMTILSSRERTCINNSVLRSDNKNEACQELLKAEGGPGCHFFKQSKMVSHHHPARLSTAFDLKEFVSACKKARACPYYGSKELLSSSDIVFCPYNYLVDPLIRSAMNISLKGSIVIMDEAHNIEDSAREAASSSVSLSLLEASVANLEKVARSSVEKADSYRSIGKVLSNLINWMKANSNNLSDYISFDTSAKVWAGDNMLAMCNYIELGPDSFPTFKKNFDIIQEKENDPDKNESPHDMDELQLLGTTTMCLKDLVQTFTYLYKSDLVYVPDYRCVVIKSKLQFGRRSLSQNPFELTMYFWCMNPAVAFSDIKGVTRSVIVASGTLSPLASFQSELGIPFQLQLEANHVVSSDKMWVGTIGKGPNDTCLSATFHNAATFAFQDDIGCVVYEVCSTIPYGVLCFLPSYGMLDRLVIRWQQTGMWEKFQSRKVVLCEPRKQGDLTLIMEEFYGAVKDSVISPGGTIDGALFFAVCRGKVSEGMDFTDDNARAVITVGIPFPNIKDAQVDLKRKYNDVHSFKKQVMNGSEWYETQAFRALNQALGRCIRHRNDFGALIIVDDRFQKNNRYPNALSKWIRKEIVHFQTFPQALASLKTFADRTGLKDLSE